MALASVNERFQQLTSGLQVVPNALTDVSTKDSWIEQIVVANTTVGAVTFKVQDKSGGTLQLVPTVSLAANSMTIISLLQPVKMNGGISWIASAANSLHAEIKGYRIP